MKSIFKCLIVVMFIIVFSTAVHEAVHVFQSRFHVNEVCFFGFKKGDDFLHSAGGWVVPNNQEFIKNYTSNPEKYEFHAELISGIVTGLLAVLLWRRLV